ncbi:hypothetical protein [Streptomyces sp. NPDC003036]
MHLRAAAVAAVAGALIGAGAGTAATAQGAEQPVGQPAGQPGGHEPDQAVGLVKKGRLTPWSVVGYALDTAGG